MQLWGAAERPKNSGGLRGGRQASIFGHSAAIYGRKFRHTWGAAGLAGICIEDQTFPKRCSYAKAIPSLSQRMPMLQCVRTHSAQAQTKAERNASCSDALLRVF